MLDSPWFSLLWALVCIVVIVGLAYWFTKHVAGRGGLGMFGVSGTARRLKVLDCLRLGRDQQVAVVQAGERFFLLGITPSGISSLAELTADEAEGWLEGQPPMEQPNFGQILNNIRKGKGQR